jgi:hypothetical protein
MRPKSTLVVLAAACGLLAAGCGGSSSNSSPTGSGSAAMAADHPCAGYGAQTLGNYQVVAAVEDSAPIVSPEAAATTTTPDTHIAAAGAPGNNDATANKHVEVHICDATSGAPAQHLAPAITIRDLTDGGDARPVPVAESYAKGEDPANVHYGNNVAFPPGHQAEVVVTLNGASATFKIAVE